MKKICIIGCGYMGLPMLLLLAKSKKYELVGYDKNIEKINLLNKHILPFEEKGMQELFDKAKDIKYVSELTDTGIDIFVVCVPTPVTNEKNCDYKYVESALKDIIAVAKKEVLIIIESTISPGGTQKIIKPILDKELNHYYLAYVSEKAIPGNTIREMCWNDRVIGGVDEKSSELTKEVYETFVMGDIYCTNSTTAEMVKVVENAARDATIAFSNELSKICYDAGISVHEVIELANHHPRISLLQPGAGVGGHCISIDPFYLLSIRDSEFIKTTRKVNDEQPLYVVEQILNIIKEKELVDPKIGVLGVAYKKNVDDSRETPALKIIETLLEKGYTLYVTDPYVKNFEYELTELDNTLENTDIIIIATGHDCYKNVDFSKHIVYDCANMDIKCKEYYILGDGRK